MLILPPTNKLDHHKVLLIFLKVYYSHSTSMRGLANTSSNVDLSKLLTPSMHGLKRVLRTQDIKDLGL